MAEAEAQVNWAISSSDSDGEKMAEEAVCQTDLITSQSESEWDRDDIPPTRNTDLQENIGVGELLGIENTPETSTFSFESLNVGMSEEPDDEPGNTSMTGETGIVADFEAHFEQPKKMAQMAPVALKTRSRSSSSSSSSGSFSSG